MRKRFDLVAKGIAWGKHVNGAWPPRTKYPLAVTFTLADEADLIARPDRDEDAPAPAATSAEPAVVTPGGALSVGVGVRDAPVQALE